MPHDFILPRYPFATAGVVANQASVLLSRGCDSHTLMSILKVSAEFVSAVERCSAPSPVALCAAMHTGLMGGKAPWRAEQFAADLTGQGFLASP